MSFPLTLQAITIGKTSVELFVPDEENVKQAYQQGKTPFPYWSKIWPSAIALSEFIVRHPHHIQNKNITESGAGLGLPSLIAARYASAVLCTDYVAEAVAIAQQSAMHNGLANFKAAVMDWHHLPNNIEAGVLLLSDVNYEPASFEGLLALVYKFLQRGVRIIISTPQRLMAKDFIEPLLLNAIQKEDIAVEQHAQVTMITVLVLAAN